MSGTEQVPPAAPDIASFGASQAGATSAAELKDVGARYIWFIVIATFGVFMAFITPLGVSLAIRVHQLAPQNEEYLGYITGSGALIVLLIGPFVGVASDRTRSRLGRRRPFIIAGVILGTLALLVMAAAPTILVLALGWLLAQMGWGTALSNLQTSAADRLPEHQRGRVAGLTGFVMQIGPVTGIAIAGTVASDNFLLFMVPGAIGAVLALSFVVFVKEPDSRAMTFAEKLSLRGLLGKYTFNPRQYPDFSWNWLGRFFFYFGLTLNTTFAAFFIAQRLVLPVQQVAGIIAATSLAGVVATAIGAIGGGFISDRLRRRKIFVLGAGIIFAAGAATMAFSQNLVPIVIGSAIISLALGVYSAVDQALLLDVLPERTTDAGRFMSIMSFASTIPQAVAPLIAPAFLLIGATAGEKNYTLLYLVAAGLTLLSGLVVLRIRSVR